MPLNYGKSKAARAQNIETEIQAGKKPAQAVAIAYSVQRRGAPRKSSHPKQQSLPEQMRQHLTKSGKLRRGD